MNTIKTNIFSRTASWIGRHKFWTAFIILVIAGGSYWYYRTKSAAATTTSYTLSKARMGTITQTVTGSGQVSASNQTDIQSQVSGTVKSVNVSVGQQVKAGQLIATIDSTNAAITLENAKISYAKIVQPAKETDISIANNNVAKAYDSGYSAVASIFLDLPTILSGMKSLLYGQDGFISDQNSSGLTPTGQTYRNAASQKYDAALDIYQKTLQKYKNVTRSSSASALNDLLTDTYSTIKSVAEAAAGTQNAISFVISSQPDYRKSIADAALTSITTLSNQANSGVSSIVSAQNSILSANNSLSTLVAGSDTLDVQSARLSLEQAQRTYDNYFIRAPYDGVIGRIPVNIYGQAGSGATIATIIGNQKIASISLNEVDAAKIQNGQPVNITFDAIEDLNASGTVSVVDQIGTVSSGVVSYGIKILIGTEDPRIKPGMSVNTSIITKQTTDVLIVPSSAVKSMGQNKYVQTLASPSSSPGTINNPGNAMKALTITSETPPTNITVTVGDSDDTNTEILSGLNEGDLVVTKTTTTTGATASTAPSILSGIGGNRTATGATRATGGAGNATIVRPAN